MRWDKRREPLCEGLLHSIAVRPLKARMMSVVSFLTKTYTGASLKAQAGLLSRHVASMDVPASQKRKMEPRIPTGGRVDSMVFKKAIAESLANADRAFASKSDKEVQGCSLRAELEVEARK